MLTNVRPGEATVTLIVTKPCIS